MQPDDTLVPMVQGSLEPWMRYSEDPRYIARAPSGFCGPPSMCRGRSGRRASISGGGVHAGHSFFADICLTPDQVNPGATDTDAVAHRPAVALYQKQELVRRIDDTRAGALLAVIVDELLLEFRIERGMRGPADIFLLTRGLLRLDRRQQRTPLLV